MVGLVAVAVARLAGEARRQHLDRGAGTERLFGLVQAEQQEGGALAGLVVEGELPPDLLELGLRTADLSPGRLPRDGGERA